MKIHNLTRDELLQYGVQYFRTKAGYIPKIAPDNECNRVDFRVEPLLLYVVVAEYGSHHWTTLYPDYAIGAIHGIVLHAKLCMLCCHTLENYYDHETIGVVSDLYNDEFCNACAKTKYENMPDDIPF